MTDEEEIYETIAHHSGIEMSQQKQIDKLNITVLEVLERIDKLAKEIQNLRNDRDELLSMIKDITSIQMTGTKSIHLIWDILMKSGIFTREALELMERERNRSDD